MLTEDEARKRWCPMARYVIDAPGYAAGNRHGSSFKDETRCIADDCAAWRWARHPKTQKAVYAEAEDTAGPRLGYCGLANKP